MNDSVPLDRETLVARSLNLLRSRCFLQLGDRVFAFRLAGEIICDESDFVVIGEARVDGLYERFTVESKNNDILPWFNIASVPDREIKRAIDSLSETEIGYLWLALSATTLFPKELARKIRLGIPLANPPSTIIGTTRDKQPAVPVAAISTHS